jgi:hypothetical protein
MFKTHLPLWNTPLLLSSDSVRLHSELRNLESPSWHLAPHQLHPKIPAFLHARTFALLSSSAATCNLSFKPTNVSRVLVACNEYAWSSSQVVLRLPAHDISSAMLKSDKGLPRRALAGIPVISQTCRSRVGLSPNSFPSFEKNSTDFGAISSWRVQPRVN